MFVLLCMHIWYCRAHFKTLQCLCCNAAMYCNVCADASDVTVCILYSYGIAGLPLKHCNVCAVMQLWYCRAHFKTLQWLCGNAAMVLQCLCCNAAMVFWGKLMGRLQ